MAIDNTLIIKNIQSREEMIVAYCAYTNMPFVTCDEETFNDQIWIFETEEQLQAFAKPYTQKKVLLRGLKYKNEQFLPFFTALFTMGINELVLVGDEGETKIELDKVVRRPDYSKLKKEEVPVSNESLVLTGMYFMQEAARPVPNEEKENLKELEEELASNMVKGRYIVPIEFTEGPESEAQKLKERKYRLPILKDKDGNVVQPIFTDPVEFQKFSKGRNLKAIVVPYANLSKILVKDAKGYMLNPAGYHIMMPRELLMGLSKRFEN